MSELKTVYLKDYAPPAYLVEQEYDLGGPAPLKLTTEVKVIPDTLPFGSFRAERPKGFLSQ